MKSIITSVSPYLCEKIASGDCKILVKKSAPKEVPFKAYIYATRPKNFYKCGAVSTSDELLWLANGKVEMGDGFKFWADGDEYQCLNGRIIGEFICDRIEMVNAKCSNYGIDLFYHDCLTKGCLTEREIEEYFNIPEDKDLRVMKGNGYVWYISNLKIYDKPKELREFKTPPCEKSEKACGNCKWLIKINTPDVYECECYVEDGRQITSPPRSWQYVEEIETR